MSYQLVLHDAWATNVHFGQQLVYTFGPYGFVYAGYDPRTFAAGLAVWLLIAAAFAAGILQVARDSIPSACGAAFAVVIAVIAAMQFGAVQVANNVPFVVLPAILTRLHVVRPGRWVEHAVAAALALGALVKFSFFTVAVGMIVVLAVADAIRRRVPFVALTFFASIAVFWVVARQPLAILPRFIGHSIDVASGYGEGMSVTYPLFGTPFLGDWIQIAAFLVVAAAFVLMTAHYAWAEAAAMLVVVFIAFKIGFMRHDGHEADAVAVLALAIGIALPARLGRAVGARGRVAWSLLALAAIQLFSWALTSRNLPDLHRQAVSAITTQTEAFAHLVTHGTDRLARRRAELLTGLHARLRRRPEGGSFDVYPSASALLIAWQLPAARRPVFQGCCAYTEPLLEMNAAHLRSAGAPDTILFEVKPLDKRFPAMDDSVSWLEILRRYEPAQDDGDFQILRRRAAPIDATARERTAMTARFDERVAVPDPKGDLLFARIDLRYTVAGRLMRLAYMTPPLAATVTVSGERPRRYRLLPANARARFLLSPMVRSGQDFARLSGDGRAGLPRVAGITVERPRFPWMFEPAIAVAFERVELPVGHQ